MTNIILQKRSCIRAATAVPAALFLSVALLFMSTAGYTQEKDESTGVESGLKQYEKELKDLVENGRKHTVSVTAKYITGSGKNAKRRVRIFRSSFSGVIIRPEGYIVTMGDPIENAREIVVSTQNDKYRAELKGVDPVTNLAVIKVNDTDMPAAEFGNSEDIRPGALVVTVGNSFGFEGSVGHGIVSGRERTVVQNKNLYTDLIQMTAPVNPGDQGGLVLNSDGKLIGVISGTYQRQKIYSGSLAGVFRNMLRSGSNENEEGEGDGEDNGNKNGEEDLPKAWRKAFHKWMKRMESREKRRGGSSSLSGGNNITPEGVHFAIPVETVKWVTSQLIKNGRVTRGWLGVEVDRIFHSQREKLGLEKGVGFRLKKIVPESPAGNAGLKQNDVLISIEGKKVKNVGLLRKTVFRTRPGKTISIRIARNGKRKKIDVQIGQRPGSDTENDKSEDAPDKEKEDKNSKNPPAED